LERVKSSYEDTWEIKITSSSKENVVLEKPSDQPDQPDRGLDQKEGQNNEPFQEENPESPEGNEREDGENKPLEGGENAPPVSTGPGLPGLAGQSYSIEESNGNKLIKCPHCNFRNIFQQSIDHHVMYKHNNNGNYKEEEVI